MIFPSDFAPHTQYGKSFGHVHFPMLSAYAFFTALSSSEWNVIIHNLPPLFKCFIQLFTVLYNGLISSFTSILIAWKVLFAGCPSFFANRQNEPLLR